MTRAPIDIRIHDSSFGIWQDNANDESFYTDVFKPLVANFKKRGWKVTADPETLKHYRSLSKFSRLAVKGDLHADIEIRGRNIAVQFWSEAAESGGNSNGKRYDFDKLKRMPYLDRQRVLLAFHRMGAWLGAMAPVSITNTNAFALSPMERIEKGYAESPHTKEELGRPTWSGDYNRKTADGALLEHGQKVWFRNECGRFFHGAAYYNINNMWWVISGGVLRNKGSFELHANQPADLRDKLHTRIRREALERLLRKAISGRDYRRAETLDRILFDGQPVYLIWSRKRDAYYGTNYSGYSTDKLHAGKYTRTEAEAEVRRVPHILEAHGDNGEVIKFEEAAA